MKNKYVFAAVLLLVLSLAGYGFTRGYMELTAEKEEEELFIVTSFYPMYVAAMNLADGLEGVRVENLSEPQTGCLHDYQLTPQDMILLSQADIFVVNGGGIEAFLADIAAEYPSLTIINAGKEIFGEENHTEHEHENEHEHEENAHAWMSIPHYMKQIETIRDGLMAADSDRADFYRENAQRYLEKTAVLQQEMEELAQKTRGTSVILLHEAFEYLAEDYGLRTAGELNLDEERQVSAGEVGDLLKVIHTEKVEILLAEDLYGKELGDTIESESDCKAYYLDTLVRGDGEKDSWLTGMENNIRILKEAFGVQETEAED